MRANKIQDGSQNEEANPGKNVQRASHVCNVFASASIYVFSPMYNIFRQTEAVHRSYPQWNGSIKKWWSNVVHQVVGIVGATMWKGDLNTSSLLRPHAPLCMLRFAGPNRGSWGIVQRTSGCNRDGRKKCQRCATPSKSTSTLTRYDVGTIVESTGS